MYLNVYWLSDIVDAQGITIQNGAWDNNNSDSLQISNTFKWPSKIHTNKTDWSIWKAALKGLCSPTGYHSKITLGKWLIPLPVFLSEWKWFVTPSYSHLFHNSNGTWSQYQRHPGRERCNRHPFYTITHTSCLCPDSISLYRVDMINTTGDTIHTSNGFDCSPIDVNVPLDLPISKILTRRTLPSHRHWILSHVSRSRHVSQLVKDFKQGKARVCRDGSYYPHNGKGAAAWRIESKNGKECIEGGGKVPGTKADMCSYRTELGGIIGSSLAIKGLETATATTTHAVLGCDNLSALNKCGTPFELVKPTHKHFDTHQDTNGQTSPLTPMALLNTKVDRLAKAMIHQPLPPSILEKGFPTVTCTGHRVSSRTSSSLYYHITTKAFITYLTSDGKLAEGVERYVAWKSLQTAKKESSHFINNMIAKWTCNQMPTAMVQNRWGKVHSPICQRCKIKNRNLEPYRSLRSCTTDVE